MGPLLSLSLFLFSAFSTQCPPCLRGEFPNPMIEHEFGVPIPGEVLPEPQWARTAIKRLPPTGPLDWKAIFGREAPIVLDLGCGNGRYTLLSALARPELNHIGVDVLPVVIRYATRRAQPARVAPCSVRGQGRPDLFERLCRIGQPVGSPSLPPAALPRPPDGPLATGHAPLPGQPPSRVDRRRPVRRPDRQPGLLGLHPGDCAGFLRLPRASWPLARCPGRA